MCLSGRKVVSFSLCPAPFFGWKRWNCQVSGQFLTDLISVLSLKYLEVFFSFVASEEFSHCRLKYPLSCMGLASSDWGKNWTYLLLIKTYYFERMGLGKRERKYKTSAKPHECGFKVTRSLLEILVWMFLQVTALSVKFNSHLRCWRSQDMAWFALGKGLFKWNLLNF